MIGTLLAASWVLSRLAGGSPLEDACGPQPNKKEMMSMLTPAADMFVDCYENYDQYGVPSKYLTKVLPTICTEYDGCLSSAQEGDGDQKEKIVQCIIEKVKAQLGCSFRRPTVPITNRKNFFVCIHWYQIAVSIE
ncbi:uncharacterized protein LOC119434668 isoform X2 [Dermacentor silvarum]|uniref:uncharacterized protein LOC119434668 isoform X2 n=1 Tax=Dermacentor silvarum TaxID=543639 RepID=UPI002100859C|nr:uncharacterized protein LOC119434668 isoform X2 [Dermacentor silvarum]